MKKIDRSQDDKSAEIQPITKKARENRWCDRHGCFIDLAACQVRAKIKN